MSASLSQNNDVLLSIISEIVPTFITPDDPEATHVMISRFLKLIGEQLPETNHSDLIRRVLDPNQSSENTSRWLLDQIPDLSLILKEVLEKASLSLKLL